MAKLLEKQRKVRNTNKANNLITQADHARASSNINSHGALNDMKMQNIGSANGLVKIRN